MDTPLNFQNGDRDIFSWKLRHQNRIRPGGLAASIDANNDVRDDGGAGMYCTHVEKRLLIVRQYAPFRPLSVLWTRVATCQVKID